MSKRKQRRHTEEFKQEAVRLALESGKNKAAVARDLKIGTGLLYSWINKYDEAKSKGLSIAEFSAEQDQMKTLKAENKQLKMENAILKKATAYFARDQL